jgi:AraC-like DNA-binding protein
MDAQPGTPNTPHQVLARLIQAHCPHDGRFDLRAIPGAHVARYSKVNKELTHVTPRPAFCVVAQGAKTVMLGSEILEYDRTKLFVISVDVPVTAQVKRASPAEPYLCLVLDLDAERIAELLLKVFPNGIPPVTPQANRGLYVGDTNIDIVKAAVRLIELTASPADETALLAPLVMDEILIRLLRSTVGPRVAQIGLADSNLHRVAKAIAWLRGHYTQPVRIEELAEVAHMSLSSFHQHFKAVTTMSPLHYQKVLRLQEARRLMLSTLLDAGEAARRVGYLSPSQFSREYTRHFGAPPTRDVARLTAAGVSAGEVTRWQE